MESELLSRAWIIIPARGGSVGIPRKNLRVINGKPLIRHVIDTLAPMVMSGRVVVVTDDEEIESVASSSRAHVILESELTPPEETLDEKILRNLPKLRQLGAQDEDILITVQPTSPLLRRESVEDALSKFSDSSVRSAVSVCDDRHLRWTSDHGKAKPLFARRVNRQELPEEFKETGGIIAARLGDIEFFKTRIISPTALVILSDDEAIDIDSYSDLYAAAHLMSRKRIAIRVDASKELGMGHVYRMLALSSELARHSLTIYLSEKQTLGISFFSNYPYRTELVKDESDFLDKISAFKPHLVVTDILDTDANQMRAIRHASGGSKIVTFEDRGSGASEADLLVAEFIENKDVPNHRQLSGIGHALLAPAFETTQFSKKTFSTQVENILVLFGGTDPSGLASRALGALDRVKFGGNVTVVRGLGSDPLTLKPGNYPFQLTILQNVRNMPQLMHAADLAFTSAGRTVIELASQSVPSICLAQNPKEVTHTHTKASNGVYFLGLGTEVSDKELDSATSLFLNDIDFRKEYSLRAIATGAGRSNRATVAEILQAIGFQDFPEI